MVSFNIKLDDSSLVVLKNSLSPATLVDAIKQAAIRTARKGVTQFKGRVAETVNIKSSEIPIYAKADGNSAAIVISDKPIPLIAFKPKRSTVGVWVKMKTKGFDALPTLLRHSFIATMRNGHKGVFERAKRGHKAGPMVGKTTFNKKGYANRFPIEELYGPSIAKIFGRTQLTLTGRQEIAKLADVFKFEVASQLSRNLGISATSAREMLGVAEPAGS